LTTSPLMLLAHPIGGRRRTSTELVAKARSPARHGCPLPRWAAAARTTWVSPGFKRLAGVDILDVPYKGGGQALTDLLGGQVGLSLIVAGNGIKHARAGKLVALAVTSRDAQRGSARCAKFCGERLSRVRAGELVRDPGASGHARGGG
jgi:hypothetical protein